MSKLVHLYLIKPTQYDDDGYVVRHWRGVLPSNTLACLAGLTEDVVSRKLLGDDIELEIHMLDENVDQIPVQQICGLQGEAQVIVGLVGVQTNQFPRAADLAREFRRAGVTVMIGGFHVSGYLALIKEIPPEIQELMDSGVAIVKGEVEDSWADILGDAVNGRLKPMYDFLNNKPDLYEKPIPTIHPKYLRKFIASNNFATLDCGRGCPFECSFCTIINVQGRKMRFRSAERIAEAIRTNWRTHRISFYFFTDDNFARNKNWEAIFDELIKLRAAEDIPLTFMMQVDVLSWKIKNFVAKARQAGCINVFIGMESVNTDSLKAAGKRQNKVHEYRQLIDTYRRQDITSHVGYIIGFPTDTVESVRRDIQFLMHEVRPDHASFFMLMPLPGSEDHLEMMKRGEWMHPDYNIYDSNHECTVHPHMKNGSWTAVYKEAWNTFYSFEYMKEIMARTAPCNYWNNFIRCCWYKNSMITEGRHPMMCGAFRLKGRKSRRPGFPILSRGEYARVRSREVCADLGSMAKITVEMAALLAVTGVRAAAERFLTPELGRQRREHDLVQESAPAPRAAESEASANKRKLKIVNGGAPEAKPSTVNGRAVVPPPEAVDA
ncbi:MAG TPA: radical SAM protein [Polyangiaceae bacterium]|nr:radical SAM protein [Polyangiaceae bacterium]